MKTYSITCPNTFVISLSFRQSDVRRNCEIFRNLINMLKYVSIITFILLSNEIYGQDSAYIKHIDSIVTLTDHEIRDNQLLAFADTLHLERESLTFLFDENELRAAIQKGSKVKTHFYFENGRPIFFCSSDSSQNPIYLQGNIGYVKTKDSFYVINANMLVYVFESYKYKFEA